MSAKATGKGAQASDETYNSYQLLIEAATQVDVIETAVAHPCDESSLSAVVHAAKQGIVQPLLVGPEASIRDVANECQLDISAYEIIDADHSRDSAGKAVGLVRSGRAQVLMKASLHSDEFLAAVVAKEGGLRTGRRTSHVFLLDVPTYPEVLAVADAAINIQPDLDTKADNPAEHHRSDALPGQGGPTGRYSLSRRNCDGQDSLHHRCCGALQDGRPRSDHRRHDRRPAGHGQRHQPRGRPDKKIDSPVAGRANILLCPTWKPATSW